jgi:hypothetical protein
MDNDMISRKDFELVTKSVIDIYSLDTYKRIIGPQIETTVKNIIDEHNRHQRKEFKTVYLLIGVSYLLILGLYALVLLKSKL